MARHRCVVAAASAVAAVAGFGLLTSLGLASANELVVDGGVMQHWEFPVEIAVSDNAVLDSDFSTGEEILQPVVDPDTSLSTAPAPTVETGASDASAPTPLPDDARVEILEPEPPALAPPPEPAEPTEDIDPSEPAEPAPPADADTDAGGKGTRAEQLTSQRVGSDVGRTSPDS